jgi:hypothetical protein
MDKRKILNAKTADVPWANGEENGTEIDLEPRLQY